MLKCTFVFPLRMIRNLCSRKFFPAIESCPFALESVPFTFLLPDLLALDQVVGQRKRPKLKGKEF